MELLLVIDYFHANQLNVLKVMLGYSVSDHSFPGQA